MTAAYITFTQSLQLAILMGLGYLIYRRAWLKQEGLTDLTNLVLYVLTPAMILNSFARLSYNASLLRGLLIALASATLAHLIAIALARFSFRRQPHSKRVVLTYALVFANCGFFALPLLAALIGPVGVFYASGYFAVFNAFAWTYGLKLMGKGESIALRKLLLNPNLLALGAGLLLFLSGFTLPNLPLQVLGGLAGSYAPVALMLLGAQLASQQTAAFWRGRELWLLCLLRNLLVPLLLLLILLSFPLDRDLRLALLIPAAAPVAGNTVFMASAYAGDVPLSTRAVCLTTIMALITIPLFAWLGG